MALFGSHYSNRELIEMHTHGRERGGRKNGPLLVNKGVSTKGKLKAKMYNL